MDALIGLVGDGFSLVIADQAAAHSICVMKDDHDKIMHLDKRKLFAMSGAIGDVSQFGEYIHKNLTLYSLKNGTDLSNHASANFIRGELATALRKNPYQVNSLMAGFDDEAGAGLYWLDYFGALQKVDFGAHGYCAYFCLSLLDRYYKPNMSIEEAVALLQKCIAELKTRFLIDQKEFLFKYVNTEGCFLLDPKTMTSTKL